MNEYHQGIADRLKRFEQLLEGRRSTHPDEDFNERHRRVVASNEGRAIAEEREAAENDLGLIASVVGVNASGDQEGGRWVTIRGRAVFIEDKKAGEDSAGESGSSKKETNSGDANDDHDKETPSLVTLRDPSGKATTVTVQHDGDSWTVRTSSGQTFPRRFNSRADAKKWAEEKVGAEINRRYEQAKADGTLKQGPNRSDVIDRQDRERRERESLKKQYDEFFKKR